MTIFRLLVSLIMISPKNTYYKVDILIIGAGQAGLSAAYYLKRESENRPIKFVVLDDELGPGGAWQHRWDSLTLENVNGIHDLPGMELQETHSELEKKFKSNEVIPKYYGEYEKRFELPIIRPVKVENVIKKGNRFLIETNGVKFSAKGIINATGTWKNPYIPIFKGSEKFKGLHLHTQQYEHASQFIGLHVIIVGAGISALQMLGEISKITTTTWVTRKEPDFRHLEFSEELGRQAVELVEKRVRAGLLPQSVVSVTGIPITPATNKLMERGVLKRLPMFDEITENGVKWKNGKEIQADVIFWNTGFKHNLNHLNSLNLYSEQGGIVMGGRLATEVVQEPRIHLVGFGPSASTVGANRAGRAAVQELLKTLNLK